MPSSIPQGRQFSVSRRSAPDDPPHGVDCPAVSRAAVRPAPADGEYNEALAGGVLRADPATGCLWLQDPEGTATVQLLLQGESYSVDFDASPLPCSTARPSSPGSVTRAGSVAAAATAWPASAAAP